MAGIETRPNAAMIMQPYATVPAYRTKDGSEIRELMHPAVYGNRVQSLAEATVPVGARTLAASPLRPARRQVRVTRDLADAMHADIGIDPHLPLTTDDGTERTVEAYIRAIST